MDFGWKIAAVSLNCQKKFRDKGASAVLRSLTVVSAELPAIMEKTASLMKFSDGDRDPNWP